MIIYDDFEFKESSTFVPEPIIISWFKGKCNELMSEQMGTAGVIGSGSSNIIFRNEERSNWSDPYDCD